MRDKTLVANSNAKYCDVDLMFRLGAKQSVDGSYRLITTKQIE